MISFIVPFRSEDPYRLASYHYIVDHLNESFPQAEVIIGDSGPQFNRSAARNGATRAATGDVLVFVDADSFVAAGQIEEAVLLAEGRGWAFPYDVYYSLTEESTIDLVEGDPLLTFEPEYEYVFPGPDPVDRPPAVGGVVVVRRDAFEHVGGYDERFIGWGFEDRAFVLALRQRICSELRVPGPLYHLWHPAPEEECFGQPRLEANRALYEEYLARM